MPMEAHGVTPLESRVRERFREIYARDRSDYLRFAISGVLLTPALLTAAIALLLFMILWGVNTRNDAWSNDPRHVLTAIGTFVGMMFGALLMKQEPNARRDPGGLLLGLALVFGAFLGVVYGTSWMNGQPTLFWASIVALVLMAMALMGRLYEPADHYYLGWVAGPIVIDNPLTFEDDIDREHIKLGFGAAIPTFILGVYGEIFGSAWLLRPLDDREEELAANTLIEAEAGMVSAAVSEAVRLEQVRVAHAIRALFKLDLIQHRRNGIRLTAKGRELLKDARGLRG